MLWRRQRQFLQSFPLYYGILWNKRSDTRPATKESSALIAELQQQRYQSDNLWLGYKSLDCFLGSNDFMQRMATDRQDFVEGLVQTLWMFFEEKLEQIQAVHQSLAAAADSES